MSSEPAGSIQSPPSAVAASPRRAVVLLMIFSTAVLFVGMFVVLYIRWSGAEEPSSAIIVAATPAFDGAELIVEGVALAEPYRAIVGDRNGHIIPFYLDRGSYTLRVSRDDKTIYSGDFVLNYGEGRRIELKQLEHLLPPRAPATDAAHPALPG
jgi:hypothetical protein